MVFGISILNNIKEELLDLEDNYLCTIMYMYFFFSFFVLCI